MKKIIASICCISMLLSVSAIGVSANDTTTSIVNSNGDIIETLYTYNGDFINEGDTITLDNGDTITLSQYGGTILVNGNVRAYFTYDYTEDKGYVYDYILSNGTKINGYPIFDVNSNYIGCCETYYPNSAPYYVEETLPNGDTIDCDKISNLIDLSIYYDANNNYDGYALSLKPVCIDNDLYEIYEKNDNGNPYVITPEGEEIEFTNGNRVTLRYNVEGEYVGNSFYSVSVPVGDIPVDTTIGDSESTPITEFTVGESTYPRGDINLDGNVNTVDLLMLKKYLLGLMEW